MASCILIGATMVSFYTVERFGRRTLILAGAIGCFIFNLVIASFGFAETSDAVNSAMLAMICLWVFTYAACFAGSCWTVAGEIATPRLRAKTLSFVVGTNAISGIIFNSAVRLSEVMFNGLLTSDRFPSCSRTVEPMRRVGV
jgi:SP family sugar:H+ symporter-like MFS transporter